MIEPRKFRKYVWLFFTLAVIIIGKIFLYDNTRALYIAAEGFTEPSLLFYKVIERIYDLSANDNEIERILNEIETNRNEHLHYLYVRTIGVIGGKTESANFILSKIFIQHQNSSQNMSLLSSTIHSLGLIGNASTVAILSRLLENYDSHRIALPKYALARALYLSIGNSDTVKQKSGSDFIVTESLKMARQVVAESKSRYRTIEEVNVLSNLNRPDRYKHALSL